MGIDLCANEFVFEPKKIAAIIGENSDKFIYNLIKDKKDIYHLKENYNNMLFNINIGEDIKYYLGNYSRQSLTEYLKNFNLDISILEKNYIDLSSSEIRKILIIIGIMSQKKIIIIDNPTIKLDYKSMEVLIKQLKKLKREEKTIILKSYNTNFLVEAVDNIIVIDNNKIIGYGNKFEILSNEQLLSKVNLSVPNVLNFINQVRISKKIKLPYRDNINDLMKDIFRYAK